MKKGVGKEASLRDRSYFFIPPSNDCPADTVIGAELETAPDDAGRVVVTPVGVEPPPIVVGFVVVVTVVGTVVVGTVLLRIV